MPHLSIAVDSFLARVLKEIWGNEVFGVTQLKAIKRTSLPLGNTVSAGTQTGSGKHQEPQDSGEFELWTRFCHRIRWVEAPWLSSP